jgi:ribosomal protein S18 acetylase RimI-like enzyme
MSVTLRPLDESEFAAWEERSKASYAEDMIQHAGLAAERAHDKAARDFAQLFPESGLVPEQHLWVLEDEDGTTVGHAWLGERETPDRGRFAYVYEIEVAEAYRGLGYGRAGMLMVEDEARALGFTRIELNVFGGNDVARGLYLSLDYEENAVAMGKDLS